MDLFRTILFYIFVSDATTASAAVSCATGASSEECAASIELLQTGIEFADLQVENGGAKADACPGFFGGVNPGTTVVTDASTPGAFMAGMTGDARMNITEPLVVMHYFPGVGQSPSAIMRPKAFGNMFLDKKSMCIMPGAPIVGSCGKYRKVEYKGCDFPSADLSMGAIDTDAEYTVRGSTVENSGLIKGCEDKVVSSTLYCYRRTAATATGPPPAVDCSSCEASLAEMNKQEADKQEDACPGPGCPSEADIEALDALHQLLAGEPLPFATDADGAKAAPGAVATAGASDGEKGGDRKQGGKGEGKNGDGEDEKEKETVEDKGKAEKDKAAEKDEEEEKEKEKEPEKREEVAAVAEENDDKKGKGDEKE